MGRACTGVGGRRGLKGRGAREHLGGRQLALELSARALSWESPARGWSAEGRAPLTLRLPSPYFPALVISCLWPDISREQLEGDYNGDLCVF